MKLNHLLLIAVSTALLLVTGCTDNGLGQQPHKGGDMDKKGKYMPQDPKFKAAMDECMNSVSKDDNGRPDREAMQSCMKEKGFERPEGKKPPHGDKEGTPLPKPAE